MFSAHWTLSCGDFVMRLYIGKDATGHEKIFAQAVRESNFVTDAEQEVLYERELGLLNPEIIRGLDRREWEERQLRWFTETHPDLAEIEKAYFVDWCKRNKQ